MLLKERWGTFSVKDHLLAQAYMQRVGNLTNWIKSWRFSATELSLFRGMEIYSFIGFQKMYQKYFPKRIFKIHLKHTSILYI